MPFWPVVLASLIGIPSVLFITGMGMIFAAAGYSNGSQSRRANQVVYGWLAFAWVLASLFGAFGLVPAWRAMHGDPETFAGGLPRLAGWLVGMGLAGLLAAAALRWYAKADLDRLRYSPLWVVLRWLLLTLGLLPWAALVGWVLWPVAMWPVRGHVEWPDAAVGWTHTAEATAVLFTAMLVEEVVRKLRRR